MGLRPIVMHDGIGVASDPSAPVRPPGGATAR
jgi:hypothetical protein